MARPATGTVAWRPATRTESAGWYARISCIDGTRPWVRLRGNWPHTPRGKEHAREAARSYNERFRVLGITATPQRGPRARAARDEPRAGGWWDRYFAFRTSKQMRDVKGIYDLHIVPLIGRKEPVEVTSNDCRKLRQHLDELITSKRMSWKTGFNTWTIWTTAMKASCGRWSRDKDGERFKVRNDYVCEGVSPPDRDDPKQLQFLYPSEFLQLMNCNDVPLVWRRIYACATYLFVRAGELRALRWEHIDLEHGVVSIRYSYDQDSKTTKGTKTGNKGLRRFAIEPELLPLLQVLHDEQQGTGELFVLPDRKHWADGLRAHLELAGARRAELYLDDATNKRLRFHDLRSTGLTWMALRGDDALKIQSRAGHRSFAMTQVYIRAAESLPGESIGTPFPPLPECLLAKTGNGNPSEGQNPETESAQGFVPEKLTARNDCGGAGNRTAPKPAKRKNARLFVVDADGSSLASTRTMANGTIRSVSRDETLDLRHVLEPSLVEALRLAVNGQRWWLVRQLADELDRRACRRTKAADTRPGTDLLKVSS